MTRNNEDAGLLARLRRSASGRKASNPEASEDHAATLDENPDPEESDKRAVTADENRDLLALVTQETRYELLQDVLAHPEKMPSRTELVYANPEKSESTIRGHLDKLIDHDILEVVELPEDERSRDLPYKFYRLTDRGRAFLEQHGLTRSEETLEQMYEMLDKSPRVERYADAPRPGVEDSESDTRKSEERRDAPDMTM